MSDHPTQTIPTDHATATSARRPDRRVRKAVAVVVAVVLILFALLAASGGSGSGAESAASGSPSVDVVSDGDPDASDDIDDASEDALDADDDSEGFADSGENVEEDPVEAGDDDGPVELDPVEDVDEQCAQVLATGATLLVTPDPAVLEPGDLSDALTIRNCGDGDTDWTAATVPTVALDTAGSTLAGGESTQLGFTIDSQAHDPGAVDFKIKVSEPGRNAYVDVHAFRKTVGSDVVASDDFSADPEGGGCADGCITKAILTPNAGNANLGFEVKTDTPADIRVWVDTAPPSADDTPMGASPSDATTWNTVLKPLAADTTYHLLLQATDDNGKTDERTTTFKTLAPVDTVDELGAVDPKCHAQCISKATVTPGADHSVQHLEVASKTPARFQAWLSTQAPSFDDGVPSFADADVVAVSGLTYDESWSVDLEPLEGSTTYHVVVRAEDTDGNVAHRVGQLTTVAEPTVDVLVSFHRLHVSHDGDRSWKNRGELSFAWAVGDTTVGTRSEHKMSDGDGFSFNRSKASYLATGLHADDFLPDVRVSGSERDADGLVEFCSMGTGAATQAGSNGDCDAKWNVASAGLVTVGSLDSLTRCSELGVAAPTGDDGCLILETPDHGDDYARFDVLVSFHVAG